VSRLCPLLAFLFAFAVVYPVATAEHGVRLRIEAPASGHGETPGAGGDGR
jgi:hypothetical protein